MPSAQIMILNNELHQLLLEATGVEATWTRDVRANPFGWLRLDSPDKLKDAAAALAGKARLCTVTAYAEERDDPDKRRRIAYHFAVGDTVITVTIPIFDPKTLAKLQVPSITPWFLNADWNEREFMELFNIEIIGHPNPKRLFLDERLDAGIMSKLIPFSAMAHGAASNTLWERVLEAKGVPLEERMPSLTVPAEPIKIAPKVTPVASPDAKSADGSTLAAVAAALAASKDKDPEAGKPEQPEQSAQPEPAEEAASEAAAKVVSAPIPDHSVASAPAPVREEPVAASEEAATAKQPSASAPEAPTPEQTATKSAAEPIPAPSSPAAPRPGNAKKAAGKAASKGGKKIAGKKK